MFKIGAEVMPKDAQQAAALLKASNHSTTSRLVMLGQSGLPSSYTPSGLKTLQVIIS